MMATQSTFSEGPRLTREVREHERKLIRESMLSHAQLAKIHSLSEEQIRYLRSAESKRVRPGRKSWSEEDERTLREGYREYGWQPTEIVKMFTGKTYNQVYRKMVREFKGR